MFAAGCPKGNQDYSAAKKAIDVQDYDAAVDYYLKANKADPHNANYKIGLNQARFQAGQEHLHKGYKLRDKGDLQVRYLGISACHHSGPFQHRRRPGTEAHHRTAVRKNARRQCR